MRRQLLTLALTGLFGTLLLSSDASACHKKRCKAPATCAPVATVVVAPCPPPAPVCEPAPKCGHPRKKLFGGLFHKKRVHATQVVYAAPAPCDTCAAPSYQSVVPSGQGF
ncbi:hypothetical protein V5E97_28915 [Singulisphaera sp. Ch08]|uniref:Secreted protein n=1 Tax=Singulisphaera sp. Ch08 TaxID=3120278 RepID=A0AAU7CB39_9BACT